MKIQYMSDLHLEFETPSILSGEEAFSLPVEGDVLVLAGDINVGKDTVNSVNEFAEKFEHVIYVTGNHEYYHNSMEEINTFLKENLSSNVHFLHDEKVTLDGVDFVGGTLWTDFNDADSGTIRTVERNMNDFRIIRIKDKERFMAIDALLAHRNSMQALENLISPDRRTVVVTHHGCSVASVGHRFRYEVQMNGGYVSNLENFMYNKKIDIWIHGHVHESRNYVKGNTRIVVNPRGYVGYETNPEFDPSKVVTI